MDFHLLGYLASSLNLLSMVMKDLFTLRCLSLCANALFILYGAKLGSTPIVLSCSIATLIHAYQLRGLHRQRSSSSVVV